mgnify:CR=1 FL=1
MNTGVIITMTTITVGSAVAQKVFSSVGKSDEAQYLDLATKAGLGGMALSIFAGFIKSLAILG